MDFYELQPAGRYQDGMHIGLEGLVALRYLEDVDSLPVPKRGPAAIQQNVKDPGSVMDLHCTRA